MESKVYSPATSLLPFVRQYQLIEYKGAEQLQQCSFPRAATGIFIIFPESSYTLFHKNRKYNGTAFFSGYLLHGISARVYSACKAFITIFSELGAHYLFSIVQRNYVDKITGLDNFPGSGAEKLAGQIILSRDPARMVELMDEFLMGFIGAQSAREDFIENIIKEIDNRINHISIAELCRYFNISERMLEFRFLRTIGISPKRYIWLSRLNKVYKLLLDSTRNDIQKIVHSLGYFDQSHLINDMKKYSDFTPSYLNCLTGNILNYLTG